VARGVENKPHRNNSVLRAFVRARWKVLGHANDPTPAEFASLAADAPSETTTFAIVRHNAPALPTRINIVRGGPRKSW